jgi:DTW domain-containing protein YfiP
VYACCCPEDEKEKISEAEWRARLADETLGDAGDDTTDTTGLTCTTYLSLTPPVAVPVPPPFHLLVYMHHKEYYRSSNTAIVLRRCLPTALVRGGVEGDETWLTDLVQRAATAVAAGAPRRLAVLYPREGESVPLTDAMEQTMRSPEDATVPLLVVVDGTWNNVRSLVKRLVTLLAPLDVTCLFTQLDTRSLSPADPTVDSTSTSSATASGASASFMRSQVSPGKVTTAEAVAAAAIEVARGSTDGDADRPFVDSPTSTCIRRALEVRVSSFTAMAGGASRFDRKRVNVAQKLGGTKRGRDGRK